jgi:putative membrane protein
MNIQTIEEKVKNDTLYLFIIGVLSIVIPIGVAILFYIPQSGSLGDLNVSFLPHLNAVLNSATAISLVFGFIFIKKQNRRYHATAMITAFCLSSIFFISYVIYHYQGTHTVFPGTGLIKVVYLSILLTHILLAIIVVPFVLLAMYFGITKQFVRHKKTVRYTFPIWLYVAISGVLVYLMISPYYPK